VQVADLRLRFGDHFAVEIENDTEHSMSGRVRGTEVQGHRFSQQFTGGEMGSMLLDSLLGSTQCVWCFVDGARAHGSGLKTMVGLLSSFLEFFLSWIGTLFCGKK
jgi:hypothetical protein